jgi:S-adenosylmethionine hydrolase
MRKFISLTSDFGAQTHGVGIMEGTALSIAPDANVIHLMHGLPVFEIIAAARTMETIFYLPVGCHVCVCDPGVGTDRKAIICEVARGDHLIGPDNGVLIPACQTLGGIKKVREITNPHYMLQPVSPTFHGRDIFVPAAAHLTNGVPLDEFGPNVDPTALAPGPYDEAIVNDGLVVATIIQINRYGSIHLNIRHEQWDSLGLTEGHSVVLRLPSGLEVHLPVCRTFGVVPKGQCLILKDDHGRVEIAKSLGSFVQQYPVGVGELVEIVLP